MGGFKKFILRGNVVDLAVAVVIGAAFGAIVQALVKDIITPIIGIFGGMPDFSAWVIIIGGSKFLIGDFINSVVAFLILAAIIYWLVVLPVERLMTLRQTGTPAEAATTRECPYCLSRIPLAASKCAYCTSEVSSTTALR